MPDDPSAQGAFVEKDGWSTLPGARSPDHAAAVAHVCAQSLAAS